MELLLFHPIDSSACSSWCLLGAPGARCHVVYLREFFKISISSRSRFRHNHTTATGTSHMLRTTCTTPKTLEYKPSAQHTRTLVQLRARRLSQFFRVSHLKADLGVEDAGCVRDVGCQLKQKP